MTGRSWSRSKGARSSTPKANRICSKPTRTRCTASRRWAATYSTKSTVSFHKEAEMTDEELAREARKQRALERLRTNDPRCGMCGMNEPHCIEAHHPADYDRDDATVLLCRNCHRLV